ncbi:hypothetical protein KKA17_03360, partial [bacterium]|nr:hypothetical protein [bacterium]
MNILLLNDNPVVTKLVTLSAQKTGNDIEISNNVNDIQTNTYDLLVMDETIYSPELMDELNEKISYKHSVFMVSRGSDAAVGFDHEVKKPFLPTDLVELFSLISNSMIEPEQKASKTDSADMDDEIAADDTMMEDHDLDELDDLKNDDKFDNLDDSLADELDLDNLDFDDLELDHEPAVASILDHDEVQEVKNLLDETDADEDDFDLDDFGLEEEETAEPVMEEKAEPKAEEVSEDDFNLDDFGLDEGECTEPETEESEEKAEPKVEEDDFDLDDFGLEEEETAEPVMEEKAEPKA